MKRISYFVAWLSVIFTAGALARRPATQSLTKLFQTNARSVAERPIVPAETIAFKRQAAVTFDRLSLGFEPNRRRLDSRDFPTISASVQNKSGGGACGKNLCMEECGTDGTCRTAAPAKAPLSPFSGTFAVGEVFAADSVGGVEVFKPDGTSLGTLSSGQSQSAGMVFDKSGNLYVTNFGAATISKFDVHGNLLGTFGSGYNADPESILQDLAGNFFVGQADGTHEVLEFSPNGNSVMTFSPAVDLRGTDWIELLSDQQTLIYTSEGTKVKSFNVSTNTQNSDFAPQLPGSRAFALRQLPDGTVLVADTSEVVRLNSHGAVIQTYTPSVSVQILFALNLDPDGTSFWTADILNGNIFKFDIASGTELKSFTASAGFASGLAIFGEKPPGTNNLTVTKAGTGTGTVMSNPSGINCGSVCTAPFATGSSVTLMAVPDPGSTFTGWSACEGTGNCSVTMNGDRSVTATFNATIGFTLTVTELGTGSGTVMDNFEKINCSEAGGVMTGTCSASYASGTTVALMALPTPRSTFGGWGGACSGTAGCSVLMSSNQSVTASFIPPPTTVSLTFPPGNLVSQTATFDCPSQTKPCTDPNASSVKLTPTKVNSTITVSVTKFEVSTTEANGNCEHGKTETTDFDCRYTTYFTLKTLPNGDKIVPQCDAYANGNCVFYRVVGPSETLYQGPVYEYLAWNNASFVPPPFYSTIPRLFDDPDDPPYDVNHQFVFDVTDYYNSNGGQVGLDPGIGGTTKHFNDFNVAFSQALPSPPYTFILLPPLAPVGNKYDHDDIVPLSFQLKQGNQFIGNAITMPNSVGIAVLNGSGVRQPVMAPDGTVPVFTYNPTFHIYHLQLSVSPYSPGTYTLLINSNLFTQQNVTFTVTPGN